MKITSIAFEQGNSIPSQYTCDGKDLIPPLQFSEVPEETKSLAIIIDDPDSPIPEGWDHFIAWNISPNTKEITEGMEPKAVKGKNSWDILKYKGPCPPNEHRYYFRIFALDTFLKIPEGSTKAELLQSIDGHILDKAELWGKYKRNN